MAYLSDGTKTHTGGDILNGALSKEAPRSPFGEYLLKMLRERKMTQADLARKAGVSLTRPKFLICGHQHPSATTCRRIADALGCSYEEMWEMAKKSKVLWGERLRIRGGDRNYSVSMTTYVDVDVKDWLKAIARSKKISYSKVACHILTRAMKEHVAKHPEFIKAIEYEARLSMVRSISPTTSMRIFEK